MRINVYHEELTGEAEVVSTVAEGTGITYYGCRVFLASADVLHHTEEDDDRSAITYWFGEEMLCEHMAEAFRQVFKIMAKADRLQEA